MNQEQKKPLYREQQIMFLDFFFRGNDNTTNTSCVETSMHLLVGTNQNDKF
jgi:hypothetical protein